MTKCFEHVLTSLKHAALKHNTYCYSKLSYCTIILGDALQRVCTKNFVEHRFGL